MNHWYKKAAILPLLTLSGCSLFFSEQEQVDEKYSLSKPIEVPENLKPPKRPGNYSIPGNTEQGVAAAEDPDLRPPTLILAVPGNARVEEGERAASVIFERFGRIKDIENDVIGQLMRFSSQDALKLHKTGTYTWQSNWRIETVEEGFWFFSDDVEVRRNKYQYTLSSSRSNAITELSVKLLDTQSQIEDPNKQATPLQLEVEELNRFLTFYNLHYKTQTKLKHKERLGEVTLLLNAKSTPMRLESDYAEEVVWSEMALILKRMGFEVDDLDRSQGRYYLTYYKPEPGFWDWLTGGDDVPPIPIKDGVYHVIIGHEGEKTTIHFEDEAGTPQDAAVMQAFYEGIKIVAEEENLEI
ncbi:outer membrane protein assembly factor BamC [Algicola sagamiensis]|uniref:outer membrane protein assembly factor BamC n=1 Tax=Algicola sagamiensis TaxID=163869 RepID=UPI00036EDAA1|nr:outer membrane protein assembly factor BamC [Algicola sagamiensis]